MRHRFAAERLRIQLGGIGRIRHRWIVHQHQQRLAFDIQPLVVVPVELRRDDAVADEDDLRVLELRFLGHVLRPRDDIVFPLERLLLGPFPHHERRRRRRDADERHPLDVGAVGVARIEPGPFEVIDQVLDRELFAARAWSAPLELVRRQHFRVRQQGLHVEVRQLANRDMLRGRRRARLGRRRRLRFRPAGRNGDRKQQRRCAIQQHPHRRSVVTNWTKAAKPAEPDGSNAKPAKPAKSEIERKDAQRPQSKNRTPTSNDATNGG